MKAVAAPLVAQPMDTTPESGPHRRPGLFGFILGLTLGLVTLGLSMALLRTQRTTEGLCCLGLFTLALIMAVTCLLRRLRLKGEAPRSHALLTDHLGFRIDFTCHDVAMTAFLDPDTLGAGQEAHLLCFLENQSSRQRVAHLEVGPAPLLGIDASHRIDLALSPGQATVYALPLVSLPETPVGDHDLPIALRITKPSGDGFLLRGAKARLHNLWTVHYATPYSISAKAVNTPQGQSRHPVFLSLASVSNEQPNLESLESLLRS